MQRRWLISIARGGTRSRLVALEASKLFDWAERHLERLAASHIVGKENVQADFLSCQNLDPGELELSEEAMDLVIHKWGVPHLDLMATLRNAKAPRFFSRRRKHSSEGMDALVLPWPSDVLLYVFPPWPLVGKVLRRIEAHNGLIILITPEWPLRPWFTDLGRPPSTRSPPQSPLTRSHIFRAGRSLLSSSLAFERRHLRKRGYKEEVISTLLRARKTSTSLVYVRVWTVFDNMCAELGLSTRRASVSQVLSLLQNGLSKGLSFNSLRVQVSAFGSLLGKLDGYTVAAHPDVVCFLKGAKHLNPPIRHTCSSWSLNLVLRVLCEVPFEPLRRSTLKDLTLKTVFLVAICLAWRVSELQALSCREPFLRFSDSGVSLKMVPSFLPKVVSSFHVNQSVELPAFSQEDIASLASGDLRRLVLSEFSCTTYRSLMISEFLIISLFYRAALIRGRRPLKLL
ncbi:uncharacterized protein LOC115085256 [Rhinatrema bivittatum]|uniref:uncharacterized protein LOC115085256 n=1 Tax=Rhinatrema bivittatum TaxID=194408 RepID=UPI001125BC1B|nr:uncharacterized protein LOC115085256 [Rhinatrema bivittatum]